MASASGLRCSFSKFPKHLSGVVQPLRINGHNLAPRAEGADHGRARTLSRLLETAQHINLIQLRWSRLGGLVAPGFSGPRMNTLISLFMSHKVGKLAMQSEPLHKDVRWNQRLAWLPPVLSSVCTDTLGLARAWQPLQCSSLENSMDRGAWWATVYGVAKSQIR